MKIILIVVGCLLFVLAPGIFSSALNAADTDGAPIVESDDYDALDLDDAQDGDDEVRETFTDEEGFETTLSGDFERRTPKCKCGNCPRGMKCRIRTDGPNCSATCEKKER